MGRPARIDRRVVLTASLAIADEAGLDAVTMQAVADRVGVTPMALYRHVADKADLLDGLVEQLLTEFPFPPLDVPWQQRLAALAAGIRATAHRHPSLFPLLLQRPAVTSEARHARGLVYDALAEAGVGPDRVARAERLISTAVLGFAASEVAGRFSRHSQSVLDGDFDALQTMLGRFVESEVEATAASPVGGDERRSGPPSTAARLPTRRSPTRRSPRPPAPG